MAAANKLSLVLVRNGLKADSDFSSAHTISGDGVLDEFDFDSCGYPD